VVAWLFALPLGWFIGLNALVVVSVVMAIYYLAKLLDPPSHPYDCQCNACILARSKKWNQLNRTRDLKQIYNIDPPVELPEKSLADQLNVQTYNLGLIRTTDLRSGMIVKRFAVHSNPVLDRRYRVMEPPTFMEGRGASVLLQNMEAGIITRQFISEELLNKRIWQRMPPSKDWFDEK
jgi:hypothetical protein